MTINSVTVNEAGNEGDHRYVLAEVDITSLDAAGAEPYDPSTRHNLEGAEATVVDAEEPRRHFAYNPDGTEILVRDRGPVQNQKSVDPASQTYTGSTDTTIATYDAGAAGAITPINFNPADPTDAGLSIVLRAEYHDGTTTDLVDIGDGTEQTRENLIDGVATGDDGKAIRKLLVVVSNNAGDVTEDIGATTTEFEATMQDAANNADVGTVTLRFVGDFAP